MRRHVGALCLALAAVPGVNAATLATYESPVEQVPLLELYTSHGCSSCPPADAWLSKLAARPDLWQSFIPLAFHVDYWDDLGWPDRFASDSFSDRQRQYAHSGRLSSVYTPGFLVGGREWQGWFRGQAPDLRTGPAVGRLSLDLIDGPTALIRFAPTETRHTGRLTAHLAILGFGLNSSIGAGENRGRDLAEDFVVLGYRASRRPASSLEWTIEVPEPVAAETSHQAIVAWVSAGTDPAPVQAVAGWLP